MYIYIARQKTIQTTCILNIYTQKYKSQEAGFSCHVYPSATNRFRAEKRAQVTGVTFKEECETGKGNLLRRIVKVLNQLQWIHDYISLHNTHWITTSMHVIRVIPNPYRICVFNLAGFTWIFLFRKFDLLRHFSRKGWRHFSHSINSHLFDRGACRWRWLFGLQSKPDWPLFCFCSQIVMAKTGMNDGLHSFRRERFIILTFHGAYKYVLWLVSE